MAAIRAVFPASSVSSGSAPSERRREIVSSDASRAAAIRGVLPYLRSGCMVNWLLIKFIFAEEYPNPFVVLNENIVGPKMSGNLLCFS